MVLPYYDYLSLTHSTRNDPGAGHWERVEDWPKTHMYTPTYELVLQAPATSQAYYANLPNSQATYYWSGNATQAAGYYYSNGQYYGATAPATTGWPYTSSPSYPYYYSPSSSYPSTYSYRIRYSYPYKYLQSYYAAPIQTWPASWSAPSAWPAARWPSGGWNTAAAQAAYYISQNTVLAQAPAAPMYFVGSTPAEIAAQNAQIASLMGMSVPANNQLIPYKPSNNPQFWCKELDGSWTLREQNDFVMGELGNGAWERHPTSGYHYYVRAPT